ncbi:class I SAM-dependent methyltransferase [Candidatus Dependentiae bacterium]|nr:class I SAM-dependent methyltransferase [Candidatus Dependentiae bacterium]
MTRAPLTTYFKLCTEFYDLEHHRGKAEASFYMNYALEAQGPILEPMCGTGRFLVPMLAAGCDIEGFDASPHMLDALRKKYVPNKAPVWQQFLQDFSSSKRYNLIFIPYGSFGLILNPNDVQKSLTTLYHHLAPGGKLVLDIETINSVPHPCGIWRRGINTRADGSVIAINTLTSYDEETQLFTSLCRYESIENGTIVALEEEDFRQYLYRFDEMDTLLKQFNFTSVIKYLDYAKNLATNEQAPLLIYECVK